MALSEKLGPENPCTHSCTPENVCMRMKEKLVMHMLAASIDTALNMECFCSIWYIFTAVDIMHIAK